MEENLNLIENNNLNDIDFEKDLEKILNTINFDNEDSLKEYLNLSEYLNQKMVTDFKQILKDKKEIYNTRKEISNLMIKKKIIENNKNNENLNKIDKDINKIYEELFNYIFLDNSNKSDPLRHDLETEENILRIELNIKNFDFIYLIFNTKNKVISIKDQNEKNLYKTELLLLIKGLEDKLYENKNNCFFKRKILSLLKNLI